MGTYFAEFDTTPQMLVYDLRQRILSSTDWTRLSTDGSALLTTSAAAAVGALSLTFTSGAVAASGLTVGDVISIETPSSSTRELRTITATGSTTISFSGAALTYAHASGTSIYRGNDVLKATTTRGVDMIVDLADNAPTVQYLNLAVYRSHTGAVGGGTDRSGRYVPFRTTATGGTYTMPLHVTLSAGKEHLFFSVEGPRANETGAATTSGSGRSYFAMCDMIPYFATDATPVVFAGGNTVASAAQAMSTEPFIGHLSRNYANTLSWDRARLGSVTWPQASAADASANLNLQRQTTPDGKYYLFPYVVCSDTDGVRGRLSSFFFAGFNYSDDVTIPGPPVGATITYGGVNYKLLTVDKNAAVNNRFLGVFGWSANGGSGTFNNSVVVAVPC